MREEKKAQEKDGFTHAEAKLRYRMEVIAPKLFSMPRDAPDLDVTGTPDPLRPPFVARIAEDRSFVSPQFWTIGLSGLVHDVELLEIQPDSAPLTSQKYTSRFSIFLPTTT